MEWLPGYSYRKLCDGTKFASGSPQTDYQMKLVVGKSAGYGDVHCENHCQNFPNDIRFTTDDGITKINHWLETSDANTATFCLKMPNILVGPNSVNNNMYYGSAEGSASDGDNTFVFIELWDDVSLNIDKWPSVDGNPVYSINVADHYLEVTNMDVNQYHNGKGFHSKAFTFPSEYIIERARGSGGFRIYINSSVGQVDAFYFMIHHGPWSNLDFGVGMAGVNDIASERTHARRAGVGGNVDYDSGWDQGQIATIAWTIYKLGNNIVVKEGAITRVDEANSEISDRVHLALSSYATKYDWGTIRMYDFKIRKYASPEPMWGTWQLEETPTKIVSFESVPIGANVTVD